MLRFLRHFGIAEQTLLDAFLDPVPVPRQRLIEVSAAVTIATDDFAFTLPVHGLQTIPIAGTPYAVDGGTLIRTPYDDCVLIMPTRKPKRGETAVRLGRRVD